MSGKVKEVSKIIPKEPEPNTIVMEYLGDESKNTKYKEMKWGNKQFIKIEKHKLENIIYLDPFKTAEIKDGYYQECVLKAPHRIINALAECKIIEGNNLRTTIQSVVIAPKEVREIIQEIACLCMADQNKSYPVLLKARSELWNMGLVPRNQLLYEKPGIPR